MYDRSAYEDIINLPHHVSSKRPQMPMLDRAAQFSPFAALTGYDDAIHETGRLTDEKIDSVKRKKRHWTGNNRSSWKDLATIPL